MGWFTGSSPKVTAMPAWSAEQQQVSGQLYNYLSGNIGKTTTYPSMGKITEQYPYEKSAQGLLEMLLSGKDSYGAQNQLKSIIAGQPVENLLQPERAKSYTAATIKGPIMQRLEQELLPAIQAAAGQGGTYFSTMKGTEEVKARQKAGEEIGRGEETFAYQQLQQQIALEEAQRNRQFQATQLGLEYPLGQISTAMQTGTQARAPQITAYSDWLAAQQREQDIISQIQTYLKQQPYQYVTDPGKKGMGSSLMSLAALALL